MDKKDKTIKQASDFSNYGISLEDTFDIPETVDCENFHWLSGWCVSSERALSYLKKGQNDDEISDCLFSLYNVKDKIL